MAENTEDQALDPRIRRTRRLLQDSLDKLLKEKSFDNISVQDIADAATVNRATFYAHYDDKFSLLSCMVAGRFQELLACRQIQYNKGSCVAALNSMVLAVCDYLVALIGPSGERPIQPHMESAIISVLRSMFLAGLDRHPRGDNTPAEMVAAASAWAIYGAAKEWAQNPKRRSSEKVAETVTALVAPILHGSSLATQIEATPSSKLPRAKSGNGLRAVSRTR